MRLVRFLSTAGICSRRSAVELIQNNHVSVNKKTCTEPAYVVKPTDVVRYKGKEIKVLTNFIYLMLNKPLGVICAASTPHDETTVIDLVKEAYPEARLYPIGRLDKDTSGLILLTNDGDLAFKISHPKFNITKKYRVTLDHALDTTDKNALLDGIYLEDGKASFDEIYMNTNKKNTVDVELHSGKNRIIRRMFNECDYKIISLHRFSIGTIRLEHLRPGEHRRLGEDEIEELKEFTSQDD